METTEQMLSLLKNHSLVCDHFLVAIYKAKSLSLPLYNIALLSHVPIWPFQKLEA